MRKARPAAAICRALVAATVALLTTSPAQGASLHTSAATFFAALPGAATTLDFEAFAAGTTVPSGSALGFITFEYAIGDTLALQVSDTLDAVSGSHVLGLDDPENADQLIAGDTISFGFATPVLALGLYLIASDPLAPGDVWLAGGGGRAPNGRSVATLADGGLVYFIGWVADGAFSGATLGFDPDATEAFLFTIDDVTSVPVPEPGTLVLMGGALAWLARRRPDGIEIRVEDAT